LKLYKKNKTIMSTVIITLVIISILFSVIPSNSKAAPLYNARVILDLDWESEDVEKPIIPRNEIKELNLTVIFRIDTGESFGKGLSLGYIEKGEAVIELEVVETSSWCSAVFEATMLLRDIEKYFEIPAKLFVNIDESAPAYGEGFIKIKARCRKLGLMDGYENVFTLYFIPAYYPKIDANLPEENAKRINPSEFAEFPIIIENVGNARTVVYLTVSNVPEGWEAVVTDEVMLEEERGSTATAYLTVIPPTGFGYHYDEANIKVTMTPTRLEDSDDAGKTISINFIVQNRGFSLSGIENIFLVLIFIVIVIVAILIFVKKRRQ